MDPLTFLGGLTGSMLGLNLLGFFTAKAEEYCKTINQASPEPPPESSQADASRPAASQPAEPRDTPVPKDATAGYWWRRLLRVPGIFGLLVGPLQPAILLFNSNLIAETLETILDRSGQVLGTVMIGGVELELTNFHLIGVLISLGQMIAGAAVHVAWHEPKRLWGTFGLALTAALGLISYEVGASLYRGVRIDGDFNASLSGLIALGMAALESTVGIFLIGCFLIPLLLAVLYSMAAPFRAIARWWSRRRATLPVEARPRQRNRAHPIVLAVLYPLVALEYTVMLPLRRLDSAVGSILLRLSPRWKQGGYTHAASSAVTHPESTHMSSNGSNPGRVRLDQDQPRQTADPMDRRA